MAAYNSVNGATMTENPLLAEPLKGAWGFDGVVVSDWGAVRSTEAAANAGTDLAMPGPHSPWGAALVAAVRAGQIPEAAVDDKLRRILRLAARVGALAGAPPPAAVTAPATPTAAQVAALVREAASAGMVLLRNHGNVLPLDPATLRLRRVAVLGPNAATGRTQGGGSATVQPPYTVSPLEGIQRVLGPEVEVRHAPGGNGDSAPTPLTAGQVRHPVSDQPGLAVRFLDAAGAVLREEHRAGGAVVFFGDGVLAEAAAVELRGRFRAASTGAWRIGMTGVGACTLELDGETVLDEYLRPESADLAATFLSPPHRAVTRPLAKGQEVLLAMTWRRNAAAGGPARIAVTAEPPACSDDEQIEQAVALARESDVAIVVVGTTEEVEREGFDRDSIDLPGRQDDLVRAVAAVNPCTIVVVNAGAPVALPWRDQVAAVLLTWFPGQEFGNALADVLAGRAEPGGRLPTTWAAEERDVPVLSTEQAGGVLAYTEGIHIGYRAWLRAGAEPAYPFGHGLGYTAWDYLDLDAPVTVPAGTELRLRVRLRNIGARRGKEVVQAYLDRADSVVERPVRWLAGFAVVTAAAGETVAADLRIAPRAFEHWCEQHHAWHSEAGRFRLRLGRSVADLRLATSVELTAPSLAHPQPCAMTAMTSTTSAAQQPTQ